MWTLCFNGCFAQVQTVHPYIIEDTHHSVKRTVPAPIQNPLDNTDSGRPLTQDCPALLIDSTTGHQNNTGTHSTSLWSAFLAIVQQGRAMECAFTAVNSMCTHCHSNRKYTGNLRNTSSSMFQTPGGGSLWRPLERFHCNSFQWSGSTFVAS